MLQDFIIRYRKELIERTRAKVALRAAPRATTHELVNGIPLFLTQLGRILKQEAARSAADGSEMGLSAGLHGAIARAGALDRPGRARLLRPSAIAITELALDLRLPIATEDFHTLNRVSRQRGLRVPVTDYARQREVDVSERGQASGFFRPRAPHHLHTAQLAFQAVEEWQSRHDRKHIAVLERSLRGLRDLIDRSVSEVRSARDVHKERIRVVDFIEEWKIDASRGRDQSRLQLGKLCKGGNAASD